MGEPAKHHVDLMPTLLTLAGASGSNDHPFDGKDAWATLAPAKPSPHEDVLINVEIFRGAVRKGQWKPVKTALLPGNTELFDLSKDISEKNNVAKQHPEVVSDLEARLVAYPRQQKTSEWLKAQPAFLGPQATTAFDPGFDIDDRGCRRRGRCCRRSEPAGRIVVLATGGRRERGAEPASM